MFWNSFQDLPVLVTGGAGFIGSHLVDALVERGARVRVLDDFSTGLRQNLEHLSGQIELLEGDIRDAESCRQAVREARYVFHQAALGSVPRSMKDPATSIGVNVTGTANVFTAARDADVRRIIYASSSSVYGNTETLPKREGEEGTVLSPYALSKHMNEELAGVFDRCFDLELLGLRYFNVYGPRQRPEGPYAAVIPRFFAASLAGEPPQIHGDGLQSRDFTYVADAVEANLRAAKAPIRACGHAYNVAPGERTTVLELAAQIRKLTGGPEPLHGPPRSGDVRHSMADPTAARNAFGFVASVGLEEGLRQTARFFQKRAA